LLGGSRALGAERPSIASRCSARLPTAGCRAAADSCAIANRRAAVDCQPLFGAKR